MPLVYFLSVVFLSVVNVFFLNVFSVVFLIVFSYCKKKREAMRIA